MFTVLQGKYAEAEPLYEHCQAMLEKVLGPEHPDVATTLNGRAGLLEKQVMWFGEGIDEHQGEIVKHLSSAVCGTAIRVYLFRCVPPSVGACTF